MVRAVLLLALAIFGGVACGCAERTWYRVEFRDATTHEPVRGATAAAEAWPYTFFVLSSGGWTPDATLTGADGVATVHLLLNGNLVLKRDGFVYRAPISPGHDHWDGTRNLWPARDVGLWYRMQPTEYAKDKGEIDVRVIGRTAPRGTPPLPWKWWDSGEPAPALSAPPRTQPEVPQ